MGRLFGTDGVRGRANDELTAELAVDDSALVAYVVAADRVTALVVTADAARVVDLGGRTGTDRREATRPGYGTEAPPAVVVTPATATTSPSTHPRR